MSINTNKITKPTIIYIEGNIGCGKSTLMKTLETKLSSCESAHVIPENVEKWNETKVDGKGILQLFYEDMDKWRSLFECTILRDRFDILRDYASTPQMNGLVIIERSAESSKEVFVENGGCTEDEWKVYCDLYTKLKSETVLPQDIAVHYLYVRTEAQTCSDRINRRNRTGESTIPLGYLQWIQEKSDKFAQNREIHQIDGEQSPDYVFDVACNIINRLIE